jgi:hypothetical protein
VCYKVYMDKPFLTFKTTIPFTFINKKIVSVHYYMHPYKIIFITDKNEKLVGSDIEKAFNIWLEAK